MNPTIFNSKSKLGAILFAVVVIAQLWLPAMGVELTGGDWEKIFRTIEVTAIVMTAFGLRDAIFVTGSEVHQSKAEEKK